GAPMTIVSPLIAAVDPNLSPAAPSEAISLAFSVDVPHQPARGFRKTEACPWAPFAPPSFPPAPTTTPVPSLPAPEPENTAVSRTEGIRIADSVMLPAHPEAGLTKT